MGSGAEASVLNKRSQLPLKQKILNLSQILPFRGANTISAPILKGSSQLWFRLVPKGSLEGQLQTLLQI